MNVNETTILNDFIKMLSPTHPETEITMETYLETGEGSSLDMSSLEIVEFIVALEEKYDIIIDIEDRYYTVGDAVCAVVSYVNEKNNETPEDDFEFKI